MARKSKQPKVSDNSSSSSDSTPEVAALYRPTNFPAPIAPILKEQPNTPKQLPKDPTSVKQLPEDPTSVNQSTPTIIETMSGTIHVKVLSAQKLKWMDFEKRLDPFVLVQLENSSPKSWAKTDPSFGGGTTPTWTEDSNNELELFYDANLHTKSVTLIFELYANESGEELIGSGQLNINSIVESKKSEPTKYTIVLNHGPRSNSDKYGEVEAEIWFGPPIRKAFRAAGRACKVLDTRDAFVKMLCWMKSTVCGTMSGYFQVPKDFAKKHRKLSLALAAITAIMVAGTLALAMIFIVPTMGLAIITFPLWIIPFLATLFFTAPLWVPILLVFGIPLGFFTIFGFGLGITSHPVRRKCAMICNKIKHSNVGKRVIYEKAA